METSVKGICTLFVGMMVLGVFNRIGDAFKSEQRAAEQPGTAADANDAELDEIRMGACLAAVDAIMSILTAPSNATIPACGWNNKNFYVVVSKDHQTAIVEGQVDAQNGFGAKHRRPSKVKLKNHGPLGWTAVRVRMEE